ncbi:glycoside hydrolase family 92 protein [Ancylomarina euxinus]|uniref:Glycoside hydrolase family 92 protein n=1 Tax=Ancylomarina euxinus TaxID=2283627 RepID=A0A425XXK2_9BACT|nr:GH92 family glycosyl hydrolase [Ancylomarina euxinus]MCZ4694716.1 GH92 family glycosyl hydrolase [Ancylomarina euxinus]MUP16380.1 glycoside hydrolase family 92 protein [Ancylomarina euxinus]RRG19411.1 glycoside hydrolase family 92 protein [Ancylomarina euxinus]
MIKNILIFLTLSISIYSCDTEKDYTKWVDPFIGTGGHGHTYPGAQVPFGMVQLSPDTRNDESWDGCGGYHYSDSSIIGFSHTHLSGTGVSDYGDVLLIPITGKLNLNSGTSQNPDSGYRSRFSHETETATPGYYSVFLDDYQVKAEMTATERIGFHRYTFTKTGNVNVLLDLIHRDPVIDSEIEVTGPKTIQGKRRSKYWAGDQQLFFAIEFSKPFNSTKIFKDREETSSSKNAKGKQLQSTALFSVKKGEQLEVKVALSAVSAEGARKNLEEEESANLNFDKAKQLASTKWNKSLSKIEVEGGSAKEKRIFYSALYHSLLTPNISQDVDGKYRGMDGKVHHANGFTNYTVFSLWDTFRALHPLLSIIEPERTGDFAQCLVQKSKEFGELPMWELASNDTRCMIGYHAVSLIADAHAKGITNFNIEEAYIEMKKTAMLDKRGLKAYKTLGYVPSNKSSQGVSKTLEYAYNDWCIAQVAKALNKQEDYDYFMNRASNYKNIYDPSVGFMRGKNDDHSWVGEFDPTAVGYNYTEGNSYQYSLFVPHDIAGITNLLGSKKELENWLDRLFTTEMEHELEELTDVSGLIGQYAHGNEPSHHMAYLYNYANAAWKTQSRVRHIMQTQYKDTPDGLCGNEDCGQMSAWYVLSSIGLYSDCPGSPTYSIGSPIFDKISLHLDNGNTFVINAKNNSRKNQYVQSASLNGSSWNKSLLSHADISKGGELNLVMGLEPNKNWAQVESDSESIYKSSPIVYLSESSDIFINKFIVDIKCDDSEAECFYTLDGSIPSKTSNKFDKAFSISESTQLKMRSYKEGCQPGYVVTRQINKQKAIDLNSSTVEKGLRYSYYEGIYRSVYDYALDIPVKTGIVAVPTLNICNRNEWIGLSLNGYIKIPKSGDYTFYMSANDGCKLTINGEEQFESDGRKSHAFGQQASLKLAEGYHKIEFGFYQCSDNIDLKVEWEGSGIKKQNIPSNVFFHSKE